jgi:hypothetical protein
MDHVKHGTNDEVMIRMMLVRGMTMVAYVVVVVAIMM